MTKQESVVRRQETERKKEVMMPDIQSMIGKEVEVIANGVTYSGMLIEVSDVEVHLKGSFQWIALPVSSVSEIMLKGSETRHPERFPEWGKGA
jgi:hypothetical protein